MVARAGHTLPIQGRGEVPAARPEGCGRSQGYEHGSVGPWAASLALSTAIPLRICAGHHLRAGRYYCDPRQGPSQTRGHSQRRGAPGCTQPPPRRGPRRAGSAHAPAQQTARAAAHTGDGGEGALPLVHATISQAAGAAAIGSGWEGGKAEAELALSVLLVMVYTCAQQGAGKGRPALRCSSCPNWLLGTRAHCSHPHWLSGGRVSPFAPPLAAGECMRAAICSKTRSEARRDVTCRGRALRARPVVRAGCAPLVCPPPACRSLRAGPAGAAPLQQPLRSARWRRREGTSPPPTLQFVAGHVTRVAAHVTGVRRMRGAAGAVQAGGAEGGGGGGRSGAGPARNGGQVLPLQRGQGLPGTFLAPLLAAAAPEAGFRRLHPPASPPTGALCAGPTPRRVGERHRAERVGPGSAVKMTRGRGERPGHGRRRAVCCDGGEGPTPRRDRRGKTVRDQPSTSDGTDHPP